jgi:signal transduction histidine kinase
MSTHSSTGYPTASPVSPLERGGQDSCAHSVQFYSDETFLLDEVSRFIGSALGAGAAGVVVATPAHCEGVAQRLEAYGLDLARAVRQGRYVALDAATMLATFMRDGWPDTGRFADLLGGVLARAAAAATGERPRVAVFGEMVALLWAEGKREAALRLEHLWNDLAQTHAFSLQCAYPLRFFGQVGDGEPMGAICAVHSDVIPAESYTVLSDEKERLRAITFLQQKAQALETEIKERRKADQQLRAAAAARDGFLSLAAHELKTPLTSLRGFAQLLLRDVRRKREIAPERLVSALEAIDRQTRKLNQLVARLLDAAQNEAGMLRIEPVSTDLVPLVHAALAPYHDNAQHTFVFEGPAQLQTVVDPVWFEQVLTNLLDNAVKFSPDGGRVTVGLGHDDDGGIRLSVTDEGVGIPPEQREAVFERFHQAHGAQHLSGLGLGLYITREIVASHGGCVWIEEPAHRGTRVVVALPPAAPRQGEQPSS